MSITNKTLACIICSFFTYTLFGQMPFEFNGKKVLSGTKEHFTISISDGKQKTVVPITIFHGKEDGEVLGITAGVHGYEYAPILAGQQLIDRIDPSTLRGTIILVQIANVESFLGRSPYTNPKDNKNLNRVFPGDSKGSLTERIADFITKEIIGRSDYFVDIHSGDAPEDLMAYVAYYQNDNLPEISKKGREMAAHMGFDHVIVFKTTGKDYMKSENPSLYCSAEAFKKGIPSVDVECGRLGMVEVEFVDRIVLGVESLLAQLQFVEGSPIITDQIAFIDERNSQSSSYTGFFYPNKSSGDYIMKGMKIGHITDFFGRTLETIHAEESGIILYMLGTPPINEGETIVNIGKVN
ncbi:MAG: M14 family metallopeptidase [Bacteroidota bacterium]